MHERNAHSVPINVVERMHAQWQADRSPSTLRLMPALPAMTPAPAKIPAGKAGKGVTRRRRRKLPAFLCAQPVAPPRVKAAAVTGSSDCVGATTAAAAVAAPLLPRPAPPRRAPGAKHRAAARAAPQRDTVS